MRTEWSRNGVYVGYRRIVMIVDTAYILETWTIVHLTNSNR